MESRTINPTLIKSRNTIWLTISGCDHTLLSSPVIVESRLQMDATDVANDEVSTQYPTIIHAPTHQQSHLILIPTMHQLSLALSSNSNIGNEVTILHPRSR